MTVTLTLNHKHLFLSVISAIAAQGSWEGQQIQIVVKDDAEEATLRLRSQKSANAHVITGTLAIASFLLSNVGANSSAGTASLLGRDAAERAEIESWTSYFISRFTVTVRTGGAAVHTSLQKLEKHLSTRSYVVGNNLTLADIAMYTALSSIASTLSPENTPSVIRLFDTIQHRIRLPYRFGAKALGTARTPEPVLCANPPLPLVLFNGTHVESNSELVGELITPKISKDDDKTVTSKEAHEQPEDAPKQRSKSPARPPNMSTVPKLRSKSPARLPNISAELKPSEVTDSLPANGITPVKQKDRAGMSPAIVSPQSPTGGKFLRNISWAGSVAVAAIAVGMIYARIQ